MSSNLTALTKIFYNLKFSLIYTCMTKTELEKLIDIGWSTRKIAKYFAKSQTTTRYALKKFGLKTNRLERNAGGNPNRDEIVYKCLCGESKPEMFYGSRRNACKKCHNEYTVMVGRDKRAKIISHMGGECVVCGWKRFQSGLQLHHLDPSKKDVHFTHHRGWSWERILREIDECVLVCACCHIGIHSNEIKLEEPNAVM